MNIYELIATSPLIGLAYLIWQHNNISIIARNSVKRYCKEAGVQLLDQNIILKRLRIKISPHSLFALQRQYVFEFSSIGDYRYKGIIHLLGKRIERMELEPFKTLVNADTENTSD
ncbi:MAG: hypothetical protein ACI9D5_000382 [Candidatus Endobugula sp.]|jgi:hypothetical protein